MGACSGSQLATTRILPKGRGDDGAVQIAGHVGMTLDPWQCEILTESARTADGRWSAFEVAGIVPRQNGKSYLVVARALAGALLYGERLIIYSAHEYRTAQETWRLMRDVCESDVVAPYVRRVRMMAGGEQIEFTTGARFKMIARTRTSGRGFSPDCLLLDEAFAVSPDIMAALLPSLAARPNPQVWYLSSAGTFESEVLLGLRKRGHNPATTRLAYWEWHADPTDDPGDPRVWAGTNPAYGKRLTEESVSREYGSLPRRAFLRERLGIWSESIVETVLDEDAVNDLTVDVPPPPKDGRLIGWGVDAAWDRTGGAVAAAFYGPDGLPVVTLVDARPGAGWIPERLADLDLSYRMDAVAYDARGGITDLMDRAARDHSIALAPMKFGDYPAACAALAQRVADRRIHFGRAAPLISDAINASALTTPTGWIWCRKTITPPTHLIAATAALWSLEHNTGGDAVAVF